MSSFNDHQKCVTLDLEGSTILNNKPSQNSSIPIKHSLKSSKQSLLASKIQTADTTMQRSTQMTIETKRNRKQDMKEFMDKALHKSHKVNQSSITGN